MVEIVPASEVVLVGAGHSNLEVIRYYGGLKNKPCHLSLINQSAVIPYAGMFPGLIAGDYQFDEAHIDLGHLCRTNSVKFISARVRGLDLDKRTVIFQHSRTPLPFDALAIDLGSRVDEVDLPSLEPITIRVKPVHTFLQRIESLESMIAEASAESPVSLVFAGSDNASVELALAMMSRWANKARTFGKVRIHVADLKNRLLVEEPTRVQKLLRHQLEKNRINIIAAQAITNFDGQILSFDNEQRVNCQGIIWGSTGRGAPLLKNTGLELDEFDRVKVNENLESVSHDGIYACGDAASLSLEHSISRSGVYSERMGSILAQNLARRFIGLQQLRYNQEHRWISFLTTGSRHALMNLGPLSYASHRVWQFKNSIDRKWVQRFQFSPIKARVSTFLESGNLSVPPCSGGGAQLPYDTYCKLPKSTINSPDLNAATPGGDASSILKIDDKALVQSSDYLRTFTLDLFEFGRTTAIHCINQLYAGGVKPHSAHALATVQFGPKKAMQREATAMMDGLIAAFSDHGICLASCHFQTGGEDGLGVMVQGFSTHDNNPLWQTGHLHAGDCLIVTKAIGSGILFAGYNSNHVSTHNLLAAQEKMVSNHQPCLSLCQELGVTTAADIGSFGLAWALQSLIGNSSVHAQIVLESVPFYSGVLKAVSAGIRASLHGQNRMQFDRSLQGLSNRQLLQAEVLFDPQTAGGLLFSVPEPSAAEFITKAQESGLKDACVIGTIREPTDDGPRISFQ